MKATRYLRCLFALLMFCANFQILMVLNGEHSETEKKGMASFGAGCFWCVEAVFQNLEGVDAVVSGYMGGDLDNPSYEDICTGTSGHAEIIQISFDPSLISFETLLNYFWKTHDPTTLNRQGADTGTQYRSVIFYHNEVQKTVAEASKKQAASQFQDPIVTEISPASTFYEAEGYHQDFYKRNPLHPYSQFVIKAKLNKLEQSSD
jgi:peptide-methionine (S)-S-oxide reductase